MTHLIFLIAWLFSIPALNNRKVPFYLFTFWILLLFLALRYGYGTDYWSYYSYHQHVYIGPEPFWEQKEILYRYLNVLVSNFHWLVAIISVFYIFTIYRLIKKNLEVKYYWLAMLMLLINPYLFLTHLSSLRQTIAICFVILAIGFAVKRKLLRFIIFIIVAAGFHQSAIMLLPVYFLLSDKKISKKGFIAIYGSLAILLVTPLFDTILNLTIDYFPRYRYYVENSLQNSLRSTLFTSFFFFLVCFNINKLKGKEIVFGKLALISTFIAILTIKFNMLGRLVMYFDIFLIIAIPLILSRLKHTASKQIAFIVVITIYLLRYASFFVNSWGYDIYKTILNM